MKDEKKITNIKLMKDVIKRRRGRGDLKFNCSKRKNDIDKPSKNIELNKVNIRELSKFSDRPIHKNKDIKDNIFSLDKLNKSIEKNSYMNSIKKDNNIINIKQLNHYHNNSTSKRSIVIFTDPPKKLSDYILKDKSHSKRKVYKMIFIEQNDLNDKKNTERDFINTKYSNKRKSEIQSDNYKTQTSDNNIFLKNSYNNNNKKKKLTVNVIRVNKMKDNLPYILKIQSFWKGYFFRKIFFKELKIIATSKLYKNISKIFMKTRKAYIKIFLFGLQNVDNNSTRNKYSIGNKKLNNNDKIYVNKHQKIEKNKNSYNNYIYKKKNKSPGNVLSFNKRRTNNIQVHNLKLISKNDIDNNYNLFNNTYYKKTIETEIYHLIKYIIKRNVILNYPFLLYRLKILQRLNFVEQRYNCLSKIIKLKEKIILYQYFKKFKAILFLETKNKYGNNINNENNTNLKNNNNNIYDKNKKVINARKKFLQNKNNLNYPQKKILILSKIITKNELSYNKQLIKKIFNRWKNFIAKKIIIPNLRSKFEKNDIITKYNSTASPKKKQIKFKKLKSNYNSIHSKLFSKSPKKPNNNLFSSFYSDNINVKKMKVHKLNVFVEPNAFNNNENKEILTKKNSSDNSYFITKVANITNKISNKINMFNHFKYWKKEAKLE